MAVPQITQKDEGKKAKSEHEYLSDYDRILTIKSLKSDYDLRKSTGRIPKKFRESKSASIWGLTPN